MRSRARRHSRLLTIMAALASTITIAFLVGTPAPAAPASPSISVLASGLQGTSGGTIGPDGAVYVPQAALGEVTRIDPVTGATSTFASGLPLRVIPLGGAIDVAFIGQTAYVLVTLVGPDVGGTAVDGIYRVDGPSSFTIIADLGEFSRTHPPATPFDQERGLQFALQPAPGGFVVSDGHHNRVLRVSLNGSVRQLIGFGNVVPTGLETLGPIVFVSQAGPVPHDPSTGRVLAFGIDRPIAYPLASGYSLIVDVELGRCGLYALSQGDSPGDVQPGSPALPNSGELLRTNLNGTFTPVVSGLNLPTSVDFVGSTAYIVTLGGEVLRVANAASGDGWKYC